MDSPEIPSEILDRLTTFGELLRYLRRRAGLTQTSLSIAVGYSDAQISRLEQNLRLPNLATVQARFLPVLRLHEPFARDRLHYTARRNEHSSDEPDSHLGGRVPAGQSEAPSIAVLPFVHHRYRSRRTTISVRGRRRSSINALTHIKGFFVVARGSAFSFRGKELDLREIGRRLNVDTILESSIQRRAIGSQVAAPC